MGAHRETFLGEWASGRVNRGRATRPLAQEINFRILGEWASGRVNRVRATRTLAQESWPMDPHPLLTGRVGMWRRYAPDLLRVSGAREGVRFLLSKGG